jgi:Flp pilus assembly protein TadD
MIERVQNYSSSAANDAALLCLLGNLHLMQGIGQYETALKVFREASKKDPNNLEAMEGMILCQIKKSIRTIRSHHELKLTVTYNFTG